jgi:hypothetical protein
MVDCIQRQFLLKYKDIFNITQLEKKMKCPERTLGKFLAGKAPLPDKWYPVLRDMLNPMCDPLSAIHARFYPTDKVIAVERKHLLPGYENVPRMNMKIEFVKKEFVKDADVVYFREETQANTFKFTPIYTKY